MTQAEKIASLKLEIASVREELNDRQKTIQGWREKLQKVEADMGDYRQKILKECQDHNERHSRNQGHASGILKVLNLSVIRSEDDIENERITMPLFAYRTVISYLNKIS